MKKRYLILKDGSVFEGFAAGYDGEAIGEAVFTTAMCGYTETLTDPSYYGQIVVQTFPLIGNYGAINADCESERPALKAYISRTFCDIGSNYRKDGELNDFLIANKIPALYGIDTRALTRRIREKGVMNAMITDDLSNLEQKKRAVSSFKLKGAVENTSTSEITVHGDGRFKVALYDFGAKQNIERMLIKYGCTVVRLPYNTTAEKVLELNVDGIMLSNGGGDPADNTEVIENLKILNTHKIPTFGICLGHQLLALSYGARTNKLKYGHRGTNQPVKDLKSGRVFITSQNHGYAVKSDSLDNSIADVRFINANDKTVEGIDYKCAPAFSVQFHPEACGGPKDTEKEMFSRFISLMEARNA